MDLKDQKPDIRSREDISRFVDEFYELVRKDTDLRPFFTDVINVDWETHLKRMYDFWENVLFQTGTYDTNPLQSHLVLHHHSPIKKEHFIRWLELFNLAIDKHFDGPNATFAKNRAVSIASVIEARLWQEEF